MAMRADNSIELQIAVDNINDRVALRTHILNQWIIEDAESKYRYVVETVESGKRIYLERPGRLNKGCDFVIYIEDHILFNNGNDKPPKHDFVIDDITLKKQRLSQQQWALLIQAISSVYNCEPFQNSFTLCNTLPTIGESYELVLKILRWFFIEQDITYWSRQGRKMLYTTILNL